MNRLIDAFEGLFTAATLSGGELAETADFTLKNVKWRGKLSEPEPTRHHIVDAHREAACANSGRYGSSSHRVAQALLAVTDQLKWRARSTDREDGPDMAVFSPKYASTCVIGEGGLLPSNKVTAGVIPKVLNPDSPDGLPV